MPSREVLSHIDDLIDAYLLNADEVLFAKACSMIHPYLLERATQMLRGKLNSFAEDVVSDTFVRMSEKTLHNYTHINGCSYYWWCCKIMSNEMHRYFSYYDGLVMVDDYTDKDVACEDYSCGTILSGGKKNAEVQVSNIIADEINKLPKIYRDILAGVYLDGHSYKDMCDVCSVTYHTVKYRLYYGKILLRKSLAERDDVGELMEIIGNV